MSLTKGYYSIIQYCPDPSRLEAVNIGVALFCPELRFLRARFGRRRLASVSSSGNRIGISLRCNRRD